MNTMRRLWFRGGPAPPPKPPDRLSGKSPPQKVTYNARAMLYLVAASILWSFSFGLIKSQLTGLNPFLVALIRLVLSFMVFLPFLRRVAPRPAVTLMAIGFIQFGVMYCAYIYSYQFLDAYQIALLTITTPIFVVMIDAVWQRRWIQRYWLAALLSLAAALAIAYKGGPGAPALKGVLLIQGANFCFALGQLLYKRSKAAAGRDLDHFAWLYFGALLAPLFWLALRGFAGVSWPDTLAQWGSLVYLGLIPTGLGFFLWNKGVVKTASGLVAVMNDLKIPLGVLVAWLVFGEALDPLRLAISGVLFALALVFAKKRGR